MTDHADLTIILNRMAQNQYWAQLSFIVPEGQTEQAPGARR